MTEKQASPQRGKGGYLEALLTGCPVAILATNAEGIITFANKEASKLVERDMHELVGESIVTIYESLEAARETNRLLFKHNGVLRDHPSVAVTKTGKRIPVRISAAHLRDSQGNYAGSVGYFETYRPWSEAEAKVKTQVEELEARLARCGELGAPVFELYPGISATVVTGPLDAARFGHISDNLLDHIKSAKSRVALIDLSGATVDDDVARQLVKAMRTIHLLGAECVLAGCQASIAKAMEPLIAEISSIKAFCGTEVALEAALNLIGYEITRKQ